MPVTRHFTATGFVVRDGHVLLHWHPKIGAWLPPGGHVEQNEDPVQAVHREVLEETGVEVEVVSYAAAAGAGLSDGSRAAVHDNGGGHSTIPWTAFTST